MPLAPTNGNEVVATNISWPPLCLALLNPGLTNQSLLAGNTESPQDAQIAAKDCRKTTIG